MAHVQDTSSISIPTLVKIIAAIVAITLSYGLLQGSVVDVKKKTIINSLELEQHEVRIDELEKTQLKAITILERVEKKLDEVGKDVKYHLQTSEATK